MSYVDEKNIYRIKIQSANSIEISFVHHFKITFHSILVLYLFAFLNRNMCPTLSKEFFFIVVAVVCFFPKSLLLSILSYLLLFILIFQQGNIRMFLRKSHYSGKFKGYLLNPQPSLLKHYSFFYLKVLHQNQIRLSFNTQ